MKFSKTSKQYNDSRSVLIVQGQLFNCKITMECITITDMVQNEPRFNREYHDGGGIGALVDLL